mgnify:CR=1 FL=1
MSFNNEVINKKKLQKLMYLTFHNYGTIKSSLIADRVKNLTFHYATMSGISLSVEDHFKIVSQQYAFYILIPTLFATAPYLLRARQCLIGYYRADITETNTGNIQRIKQNHFMNILKYLSILPVLWLPIFFDLYKRSKEGSPSESNQNIELLMSCLFPSLVYSHVLTFCRY